MAKGPRPGDKAPDFELEGTQGTFRLDAVVVGISSQGLDSHNGFVAKHNLNVPLLADTEKVAAGLYGMTGMVPPGTKRGVVIVDAEGVVRYRHDHRLGLDFQTVEELQQALAGVPA